MSKLKECLDKNTTVKAIYDYWKKRGDSEQHDTVTLGASQIGHVCERYLWYAFRHCCRPDFDGRLYRLFDRGNIEEARVEADLKGIGCEVHTLNEDGKQFRVVALSGHVSGRMDGAVFGVPEAPKTWHVLEIKTHNAKSYKAVVSKGVTEAKKEHYAQMQIYMHLTGMKRALYVAVNKDTDELHIERIKYNKQYAEELLCRAKRVITSSSPPERISDRPDYYLCGWCDAKGICFGSTAPNPVLNVPILSCRQCCHATPSLQGIDGRWVCELQGKALTIEDQTTALRRLPCNSHLCLPGLFATQEVVATDKDEAGNWFIRFKDEQYGEWRHGAGKGNVFSSEELRILPLPMLNNGMINTAKEKFGAEVIIRPEDILDRYPPGTSDFIWAGPSAPEEIGAAWKAQYDEDVFALQPIAVCNLETHSVAEYEGNRILVVSSGGRAGIWQREKEKDAQ